jgi:hypothetical protein
LPGENPTDGRAVKLADHARIYPGAVAGAAARLYEFRYNALDVFLLTRDGGNRPGLLFCGHDFGPFYAAALAARSARSAPTFQADILGESFLGFGIRSSFTHRQRVAGLHPYRPQTVGCRTWAESGSESNSRNAPGIPELVAMGGWAESNEATAEWFFCMAIS